MEDNCSNNWFKGSKKAKYSSDASDDGVDRISALPDKILGHMLSFLPTKNAVGTSVLSHRWQYLFTLVTKLDFDEYVFFDRENDPKSLCVERLACLKAGVKCPSSFKDFVNRVLQMCQSSHISSFRLKCGVCFDCSNVSDWIRFALLRGVAELEIYTYEYESSILPPSLFSSEILVVLKLCGYFELKFPESFQLPKLKSLQLSSVKFEDEYSLNRLLAGCPVLEDLELLGGWEDVKDIILSSPSVKRLTMDFSEGFMSEPYHRTSISLDLPNLIYFKYVDYLAEHYNFLKNLNSVEEARLNVILDVENMMRKSEKFCTAFLELANGVSAAKLLFFSGRCMQALKCGQEKLPTFSRLTRLELGWTRYLDWRRVLPDLLNSTPNLETLVFREGIMHCESDDDYEVKTFWSRQRKIPPCLSRIKLIEITPFHGFNEELQIARYFIRSGKVDRMLVLDWEISTYVNLDVLRKLDKFANSKRCTITGISKLWAYYH